MLTGGKNYYKIKIVETAQLALPHGLQIYLIFTISENVDHTDRLPLYKDVRGEKEGRGVKWAGNYY